MKIVYTRQATEDFESIFTFIAERTSGEVAKSVVARIILSIERLRLFPESGRAGVVAGTLELVVPRLPYIVVYQIEGDEILIRGVFHGAQDR